MASLGLPVEAMPGRKKSTPVTLPDLPSRPDSAQSQRSTESRTQLQTNLSMLGTNSIFSVA